MIPKFEKFLYPFLLFLKDGELTTSQMIEMISQYFELTEEDKIKAVQWFLDKGVKDPKTIELCLSFIAVFLHNICDTHHEKNLVSLYTNDNARRRGFLNHIFCASAYSIPKRD